MIPGEILIIELEEIADSSSFPRETEGKEGEREDAASPVDKRGRGKTRWSRFKESIGGEMHARKARHGQKRKSRCW